MICHKFKTIFTHIPKTGGTSIEAMFGFVQTKDGSRAFREGANYGKHFTAKMQKKNYGEDFKNYYKFSIVRNPWEKELSMYNMMRGQVRLRKKSFKEFLEEVVVPLKKEGSVIHADQVDYLLINDQMCMNDVFDHSEIEKSWEEICKKVNKPIEKLKHVRKKASGSRKTIDDECKEIIYNLRKRDIEYFEYKA